MEEREIKRRIIKAASEMFYYHGFSKVTLDEVAEKIGISKKTIYNHYDGKREVLRAVLRSYKEEMEMRVNEVLSVESLDFVTKLKRNLNVVAMEFSKLTPLFVIDLQRSAVDIWEELVEFKRAIAVNQFNKLVESGKADGLINEKLNVEMACLLYLSALENIINPKFIDSLPLDTSAKIPYSKVEIFNGMIEVLFAGMLTDEGRRRMKY